MTTATARSVRLGNRDYPVVLPGLRDSRLHLAAVIITIHVLGQTGLGFRVSVPQILAAILTCAVIEVVWTLRRTGQIVWPASAMLTGSGVALILRLVGAERGDHWTWRGWHVFAAVGAVSLASKYLIRRRGSHVFNPSNVGLVMAFVVLGSEVVEPLDFWWAPLGIPMVAAYVVILAGGVLITRRLGLLPMAAAFWSTLALGLAVLSASGHCMTAAWALRPVCGQEFWRVVVVSPEVLIFLFFMITDPRTVPAGPSARVAFAASVGIASTLLIAPAATEFGAKVGLLAGLVILTPFRHVFDRLVGPSGRPLPTGGTGPLGLLARGAAIGSAATLVGVAVVAAGIPSRGSSVTPLAAPVDTVDVVVDASSLPEVLVSAEAEALSGGTGPRARDIALAVAEALAVEAEAVRRADTSLLRAADDGERLVEMERLIEAAATSGRLPVRTYSFDTLHLDVAFADGPQGGASLALEATGTVEEVTYTLAGEEVGRAEARFRSTFVLRPTSDGGWLLSSVIED